MTDLRLNQSSTPTDTPHPRETTHTFKVGDRGKTVGGDDYEITAVGRKFLLCAIAGCEDEGIRRLDGSFLDTGRGTKSDLYPPKRRITGWVPVYAANIFSTKGEARRSGCVADAYVEVDIEEGEGLEEFSTE